MSAHHRWIAGAIVPALLLCGTAHAATTVYSDGVSPPLTAAFDLGTHLPNYIGATVGSAADGTALDGQRVYFYDADNSTDDPATATPFNLLVWQFAGPKDSVRLYTHQDHYNGGPIPDDNFTANEVLEYSVWGCNGVTGGCKTQDEWTLLSDPVSYSFPTPGAPEYSFAGTDPAAQIFRGGSSEFGLVNAYTQDFSFGTAYNFFAIRGSTIAMLANTADPELDAMAAFNRADVPIGGGEVPLPASLPLLATGFAAVALLRRKRR